MELNNRNRDGAATPIDDIILCLPSTFDLAPQILLKHIDLLITKLNVSNTKYISDAMLSISPNKELIRVLIEYVSYRNLIKSIIKPIWNNHPHQDVRVCLILSLFHFIGKTCSKENINIIWKILEKAAMDNYPPIIKSLFASPRRTSRSRSSKLKTSLKEIFERFVKEIQFKVLDHSTLLEARLWA
ncbi:unnamed protein product [Adineta steineri]|uniref:Uncharacterized protein n=1 Tax=Adineta steineri TaxID=433720 RepID=A0A819Y8L9_9BILA|nr:unnamed protein product [Adineta steineri]CAF4152898.1 unnamed protein product [Adineta steineri]